MAVIFTLVLKCLGIVTSKPALTDINYLFRQFISLIIHTQDRLLDSEYGDDSSDNF